MQGPSVDECPHWWTLLPVHIAKFVHLWIAANLVAVFKQDAMSMKRWILVQRMAPASGGKERIAKESQRDEGVFLCFARAARV